MELLTDILPLQPALLAIGCLAAIAILFALGRASARDWDHSCISPFGRHEGDSWTERGEARAGKED